MIKTIIIAENGCISSGVIGVIDFLAVANVWWMMSGEGGGEPLFETVLVTLDGKSIRGQGEVELKPQIAMGQVEDADLIIAPPMFPPFDMKNPRSQKICSWLLQRYERGDTLAAQCTGSFFLAETGLLDGKKATTNWLFAGLFRTEYPLVKLLAEEILTEDDRLICAGAASAFFDLCLHLVEKYGSRDVAIQCSKNFLMDPARHQGAYMRHDFWKNHVDSQVLEAQLWMEENYTSKILIDEVADKVGIGTRQFARRFKHATGETPLSYLQHLRIEKAKQLLEMSNDTVSEITWNVGYEDIHSFRRLFIKHTGMPPKEYRNRFSRFGSPNVH